MRRFVSAEWATGLLLTFSQEFSIEIPDKEADGILSSKYQIDRPKFHLLTPNS